MPNVTGRQCYLEVVLSIGCSTFESQKRSRLQSPQVPISQASINEHFLCLHREKGLNTTTSATRINSIPKA